MRSRVPGCPPSAHNPLSRKDFRQTEGRRERLRDGRDREPDAVVSSLPDGRIAPARFLEGFGNASRPHPGPRAAVPPERITAPGREPVQA